MSLSLINKGSGAPEPFKFKEGTDSGCHQMNDYPSQIEEAPFVIAFGSSGTVKDFKIIFPDKILDVPFQPHKVCIACHCSNDKKICPEIELPHIHDNYIQAAMISQKFSQFHCPALQSVIIQ